MDRFIEAFVDEGCGNAACSSDGLGVAAGGVFSEATGVSDDGLSVAAAPAAGDLAACSGEAGPLVGIGYTLTS